MKENDLLQNFEGISLDEMDAVKLMNRIDTKYVFKGHKLIDVLKDIEEHYFILEINAKRSFPYISLYFDTDNDYMYLSHHNGKLNRHKIRFRKYIQSDDTFLEIKKKVKGTLTLKKRIEVSDIESILTDLSKDFIGENTAFEPGELKPTIYTNFDRITLVNKNFTERVTIDRNLQFIDGDENASILQNTVIIEVKRSAEDKRTFLIETLNKHRISPSGMSKYCIGRALLEPNLKSNNFKAKILTLNKFENDSIINSTGTRSNSASTRSS